MIEAQACNVCNRWARGISGPRLVISILLSLSHLQCRLDAIGHLVSEGPIVKSLDGAQPPAHDGSAARQNVAGAPQLFYIELNQTQQLMQWPDGTVAAPIYACARSCSLWTCIDELGNRQSSKSWPCSPSSV